MPMLTALSTDCGERAETLVTLQSEWPIIKNIIN